MNTSVLLVGLGAIGMGYDVGRSEGVQAHARAFATHPSFRLVAGVDTDADRRAAFSAVHALPAFDTAETALAAHAAELVVIATPTSTHAEVLDRVLAASTPRAILCEKPLAASPAQARAMLAACAARGVELYVNYFRRSLPGAIEVRRRLVAGEIAAPVKAVSWYGKGFVHNGSHFVDLLGYWLGGAVYSQALGPPRQGVAGEEIDCRFGFGLGEALLLCGPQGQDAHFDLELLTGNGQLRFDTGGGLSWRPLVPAESAPGYHVLSPEAERLDSGMARYQWHVADQLARRLAGKEASLCAGDDALSTLESMHAALAAARGMK